jgi:ABC-type Mn2+/Zn2+ transport system ATPase subunit
VSGAIFDARDLALGYGRRAALRGVTLEVRAGELWFFVGPNGSGKTTLLRGFVGELRPLAGELRRDRERAALERIGLVPQRCDVNPSLPTTVREFVSLGLVGIGASRAAEEERVAEALREVGLGGFDRRSYWALSGGQRQRVLLARALARRPDVLILDEPTAGLDLGSQHALLELLVRLWREGGRTLVFVTHDLSLAARHATHVALFHDGTAEAGPTRELLTAERLERAYGAPVVVSHLGERGAMVRIDSGRGA